MLHKLNSDLLSLIVNRFNILDFTKLQQCIKLNDKIIDRYIKCNNISFTYACFHGHLKFIKYMYKNQNNITNQDKEVAIDVACEYGYIRLVKYLHRIVKAECTEHALNYASANGNFEVVKYLVEVMKVPYGFDYAIYLANIFHQQYIIQYLQNKKDKLTIKNNF